MEEGDLAREEPPIPGRGNPAPNFHIQIPTPFSKLKITNNKNALQLVQAPLPVRRALVVFCLARQLRGGRLLLLGQLRRLLLRGIELRLQLRLLLLRLPVAFKMETDFSLSNGTTVAEGTEDQGRSKEALEAIPDSAYPPNPANDVDVTVCCCAGCCCSWNGRVEPPMVAVNIFVCACLVVPK